MRSIRLAVAVAGLLLSGYGYATPSLSLGEKATLQAAMQTHIDRSMVDGAFLRFDPRTGDVEALRLVAAHPAILRMGDYFVLCADFRAPDGEEVNVDFYLAPRGGGFVVFAQEVENRALVKHLLRSGRAERVD